MKPWQKRTGDEKAYRVSQKAIKKTFLILCENLTVVPYYFRSIPVRTAQVKAIGVGESKVELVEMARRIVKGEDTDKDTEIWLVFDRDVGISSSTTPGKDFDEAESAARKLGYKTAWSNPCFELWLLLHFEEVEEAYGRKEIIGRLDKHLGMDYLAETRKPGFSRRLYSMLEYYGNPKAAIERAEKLFEAGKDQKPSQLVPGSTVFQLLKELEKFQKP